MSGGILKDNADYSGADCVSRSATHKKSSRICAIRSPCPAKPAKKDTYVSSEEKHTNNISHKNILNKPPLKHKKCHHNLHERIQKRIARRLSRKALHHLYSKANFRKLLAEAIMAKVELQMSSAYDARDNILRGHSLKGETLESKLTQVDKQLRRFLRLGNFYRKNEGLENAYKSEENNIRQFSFSSLDIHC